MNIFVSNLSFNIQDEDLEGFFTEFGTVTSAKVIMDRNTSQSRGFGFVEMPNREEAQKAIEALDGAVADGRAVRVSEARPKEDKKPSGRFASNKW